MVSSSNDANTDDVDVDAIEGEELQDGQLEKLRKPQNGHCENTKAQTKG